MESSTANFCLRLKSINSEVYKDLVDKYEPHFKCVICDRVPTEICYITRNCSHYLCAMCEKTPELPKECPKCGKQINNDDFLIDPLYNIFYECYKQRHSPITPENKWSLDQVKNVWKKLDYLLQDACCKVFNEAGGELDYIKYLVAIGANPNVLNRGQTLMHDAVYSKNVAVLEVLLEGGGIVNAYSLDKCSTCLHDALDQPFLNVDIIKTLLNYGANIHLKDRNGATALDKAKRNEHIFNLLNKMQTTRNISLKTKPLGIPVLYGSNLKTEHQKKLALFCNKFKVKLCRLKISKEVTHVIVEGDPCVPTHGVLMGILQGCFIVSIKWIEECLKTMSVVNPEMYEITGTLEFPKTYAAKRSRICAAYLKPRLFTGGQFKFLDGLEERLPSSDKENIIELITTGGGTVLTRNKSCSDNIGETFFFHAYDGPVKFCNVVVIHKNEPSVGSWDTIGHASIKWITNCIQAFKILS